MPGYEREVREYLRANGLCAGQGRPRHNPITNRNVTVDRELKSRHTANAILKKAGIGKKF